MKRNDLSGQKFGCWEVISCVGKSKYGYAIWRCRCTICGSEHDVASESLTSGRSTKCRSCSATIMQHRAHSSKDPIHNVFVGMKQRCYYQSQECYARYGGRGVSVCDEWRNDFQAFAEWAYSHGYAKGMSIERIDYNGDYCPDNCKFIPLADQSKNRRNTIWIEYNGKTYCAADACRLANVSRKAVESYAKRHGISFAEAFLVYTK